ncbi:MAG: substrate-binding domain-containing protein [Spirochaetales bacterium]|nr:substrate-binding domain-containing protein [Spirochaetales bacterium]
MTRTIALLGCNLYYEIPIDIFRTARKYIHQKNYRLLYFSGESYGTADKYVEPANVLYNLITPKIADGLIITSNLLNSHCEASAFRNRCLAFHPLPTVSLGVPIQGIPSVIIDDYKGMYEAVSHLIEEHHFSKIAFIKGPQNHYNADERFRAFKQAMVDHQLKINEELVFYGNFEQDTGSKAVKDLLDIRQKRIGKDVDAIVCANDYMAYGALVEFQSRGIIVPEDIALIGFDNIGHSQCLVPPISTVNSPFKLIASMATETLFKILNGQEVPEIVAVESRFIQRCSCGCPDHSQGIDEVQISEEIRSVYTKNPLEFHHQINTQLLRTSVPTFVIWKQALTSLRKAKKWDLIGQTDDGIIKNDWSALLLGNIAYQTFNAANFQSIVFNMGSSLTSTLDLSELFEILTKWLPEAQIRKFCVCLFDPWNTALTPLPRTSRLILAFDGNQAYKYLEGGLSFSTSDLLPHEINQKMESTHWVILSLDFQQHQLGYMLVDSDSPHENLHFHLRKQISSALMGTKLLEETKKANDQKTQFFINVAHETKTPLTLIKNYLSLYMKEHETDDNLTIIQQNIDLLLKNMLNFLDVEKLQKGNPIYQHDSLVDLSQSAKKKCELFRGLAAARNITIRISQGDSLYINIDPWALDRIFNNLLDNAVKYTHPGGEISVSVKKQNNKAVLKVCDDGPGLPVDTYEHIFEPYYLLSQKKTSKQGIGVGLSIVKKIIDELGAEIIVTKPRNGGVCFTILFEESSLSNTDKIAEELPDTSPSSISKEKIQEKPFSDDKPTLLIVDDNIQLLHFIQSSLEKSYNLLLAKDVSEALFKLKTGPRPDIIIADIMMDGEDGFALLKKVTAKEKYNNIPFIFLTAMSGEEQRVKGLDLGAVDYIEKPFSIVELTSKIDSIINLRLRQEKQNIDSIKHKINSLFSNISEETTSIRKKNFSAVCDEYGISGREPQIIELIIKGMLHKEIAAQLNISLRGVEYHIAKIYKKCGVANKYELIAKFQE